MDEKKLRVYTTAVSIAGLSVFLLSLWEVYPYYLPGSSRGDIWSYSLMMVLLMVVCRMLPIYFAEDKTLEISFVPVLACAITGGAPLAVVLFGVSTLFTVMQNPATKHYYWPLAREPRKELFNTGNILVSISAGGLPLLLAGMPDNLASLPALGLSLLFAALCILVNLTLFILYYQVGGMGQFGTLMRQNIGGLRTLQMHQNGGDNLRMLIANQIGGALWLHKVERFNTAGGIASFENIFQQAGGTFFTQSFDQYRTQIIVGVDIQCGKLFSFLLKLRQHIG